MKYLLNGITIFLISILLIGCDKKTIQNDKNMELKKMNIIYYESKEFKEFIDKNPKINLNKAWELHQKYYNKKLNENIVRMNFIINNYYVFSEHVEYKLMEASIEGLWIHSNTGETKYVKSNKTLMPNDFGWRYNIFK